MRQRTRRTRFAAGALVAVMALFAAGCGDDGGDDGDSSEEEEGAGGREQEGQFDDLRASDDLGVDGETDDETDDETDEETDDEETDEPSGDEFEDYVQVEDSTGALTFDVPEEWSDVDDEAGGIDPDFGGVGVAASTDLVEFQDTYDVPGLYLTANAFPAGEDPEAFVREYLDTASPPDCEFDDSFEYDDGFYLGEFDIYTDCLGTDTALVFLVAVDPDEEYFIALLGQVLSDADLDALDQAVLSSIYLP